jgi:hypothetical protein
MGSSPLHLANLPQFRLPTLLPQGGGFKGTTNRVVFERRGQGKPALGYGRECEWDPSRTRACLG